MVVKKTQPLPIECVVARLRERIGLEGLQSDGRDLRNSIAGGNGESDKFAGADFYAGDESDERTRRKHLVRTSGDDDRQRLGRKSSHSQH